MKKANTNNFKSKVTNQKQVFTQKKAPVKKVIPEQKIWHQNPINQSTLNDTLDQFVNTTDMNLDNIPHIQQNLDESQVDKSQTQLDHLNDASCTLDPNEDNNNVKLNKFDGQEFAQNSIDYKNFVTSSTPSIINDQLYFKNNKSESTLSNITLLQVKAGQKKQNEQNLDEDFNLDTILPQEQSINPELEKPKKNRSKKNSVAKVQKFNMDEEDEYEYEDEDEEQSESQYEDEEEEEEEEKNQKDNGKITMEQLVTLDPMKNQGIQHSQNIRYSDQNKKFVFQGNAPAQTNTIIEKRVMILDQSIQDSNQSNKNSPNFGNKLQGTSQKKSLDNQNENYNQQIISQNPEAFTYFKSSYTTQNERNSLNFNSSQQTDIARIQSRNSRQVQPLQLSINNSYNFVQNYGVSPNNIRYMQQNMNQEMQMNNANQKQGIIKQFGSRANSISRGRTPSRVQFPNIKETNSQINKEQQIQKDQLNQEIEPVHCKICLETDCTPETGKMITPCKCSGTLRNVHEECLKTWILTKQKEIMEAQCEVCMKPYEQTIEFGLKLNVKNSCNDGKMNCLTSSVVSMFVIALIIVISLLFKQNDKISQSNSQYASSDSFLDSSTHVVSLITICFVILVILLAIIYYTLKEACCILVVKQWLIEQYVPSPQVEQSQIVEGTFNHHHNSEYQNQLQSNLQNNKIITYQQFLMERRSMPAVMPQNFDEESRYITKNNNFNQSRNSPKSQAQSCVTQMQNKQQKNLTKQEQQKRINQLLKSKKQLNKPILFNQRIYSSSRRQSQNNSAVRISYDLS